VPVPKKDSPEYLNLCSKTFAFICGRITPDPNSGTHGTLLDNATGLTKLAEGQRTNSLRVRYKEYRSEKTRANAWEKKTFRARDGFFKLVMEVFGKNRDVRSISHADMKMFRDAVLCKMPSNRTKHPRYKGKNYREIIAMPNIKPLSIGTVNDNLNILGGFFKWCITHDYADKNPATGLALTDNRREDEKRKAYAPEDLQMMLKVLPYGSDALFKTWIPIIGMFSCMRQNEVAQLHVSDVRDVEGVLCFDINADARDKKVKSKAAIRSVPVHPCLVKMGFLDYHRRLKERGQARLWPELEYKRDGYGQTFQRWFGRFNRKHVTDDPLKCFHSLRHLGITRLKLKGVEDTVIMELVGHTNPSMTTGRYGKRYPPSKLLTAISKLDYGFDAVKIVQDGWKRRKGYN